MRYVGGKVRIGKQIATYINRNHPELDLYWEPFCGMFSVGQHVQANKKYASDIREELIILWNALHDGWLPPKSLSKDTWTELKNSTEKTPEKAFAGFGCSHSGVWFCSYASDQTGRNYALNAYNSLIKKTAATAGVTFQYGSYSEVYCDITNAVIYCDPPYKNTGGFNKFDHQKFWEWVRKKSQNNTVLVSEYQAPDDFEVVWQKQVKLDLKTKLDRTEKLFKWRYG